MTPPCALGTICAGGTLGILIPPSVMLVVMGPVFSVSVARLYAAAIIPGLVLSTLYIVYTMTRCVLNPKLGPAVSAEELDVPRGYLVREFFLGLIPPASLILATLGSIITGFATPTEGAAVGCLGAILVTWGHKKLTFKMLKEAAYRTLSAIEAAICSLAIANGRIPPTVNYETQDPDCDLDYVPNQARECRVDVAMNNAYAFGGNNASLILKRYGAGR